MVQSATRSAGGTWSAPVTLSSPRKAARSPQITLDPQGGATAVWEEEHSGAIESATRSAGGSWSAPVTLSATGVGAAWPQVAVDSQGNATAVWAGNVFKGRRPQSSRIQSATRPAGGIGRRRSASRSRGTATYSSRRSRSAPRAKRPRSGNVPTVVISSSRARSARPEGAGRSRSTSLPVPDGVAASAAGGGLLGQRDGDLGGLRHPPRPQLRHPGGEAHAWGRLVAAHRYLPLDAEPRRTADCCRSAGQINRNLGNRR
jgi:hypothetical protein